MEREGPSTKKRLDNTQQRQCTKHTLKHSNTPTHRDLGAIPLLTILYPPYYKYFGAKQHEQQRALEVGMFSPNQYKSCVCLAHYQRLRRAVSFTCPVSRRPPVLEHRQRWVLSCSFYFVSCSVFYRSVSTGTKEMDIGDFFLLI
jgi:hypothetical protein